MAGLDELVSWLRAAIEERLRLAREAAPPDAGRWYRSSAVMYADGGRVPSGHLYAGEPVIDRGDAALGSRYVVVYDEGSPAGEEFEHIAANDPLDTIARCEAELALVDLHDGEWLDQDLADGDYRVRQVCTRCDDGFWPCRTVRLVGYGYRRRPGYREAEWKP